MKIEIGESVFYSWLRHIKHCQIVQTNWKPSNQWHLQNFSELESLFHMASAHFKEKHWYEIFKKTSSFSQFLQQAEIDVLGVCIGESSRYYAAEIAYHESGTNYGSRQETVSRIIKKIIRSAICLNGYMNVREGDLIFASPKIGSSILKDLEKPIEDIENLFNTNGLSFTISIIANNSYFNEVLNPLMKIMSSYSDSNELFMRSIQLAKMFESNKLHNVATQSAFEKGTPADTKISESRISPEKEFVLQGVPCSIHEFERYLRGKDCEVRVTLIYQDSHKQELWHVHNFGPSTSLSANLGSGYLRGWREKGITGIKLEL